MEVIQPIFPFLAMILDCKSIKDYMALCFSAFSLLGPATECYLSCRYYRGRGAFESMGAGIDMAPGDIAFKCNFATLDTSSGMVIKRRADRHFEDVGPVLCAALDGTWSSRLC